MEINAFLYLAIIIVLAKLAATVFHNWKLPPVVGILLLGIILGPSALNIVHLNEIISWVASVGVLFLLFEAGLNTDIRRLATEYMQSLSPALGGVFLPFGFGFLIAFLFGYGYTQSLIAAVIFTATSISVSVMTLIDLGKLKGIEGRCIVNAAIIDDIIGILLLTFILGFTLGEQTFNGGIALTISKIILFFVLTIAIGIFLIKPLFSNVEKFLVKNSIFSYAIAAIFFYAWFAEFSGIAALTGAYFAGVFIGQTEFKQKIHTHISELGNSFFVDVFFVTIGLQINILIIDANIFFLLSFVLIAILSKFAGSFIGARLVHFDSIRAFRIGSGMIPRGEVALIVASMALDKGVISSEIMSATILMVIISAVFTPLLLKYSFKGTVQKSFKGAQENVEKHSR